MKILTLIAISLALAVPTVSAAPPNVISHQGRISVGGVPFHDNGFFRFALVNADGTQTYWSNDGTSTNGGEPTDSIKLAVRKGLYEVRIGDDTISGMDPLPDSVLEDNDDVHLRIWFDDGITGSQLLSPDRQLASVAYSYMASTVPDGSITNSKIANNAVTTSKIAGGAVTGSKIASGAIGSSHLADNAVTSAKIAAGAVGASQLADGAAAANLLASGQSPVGSGGIILSQQFSSPELLANGYARIGSLSLAEERWTQLKPDGFTPKASGTEPVWTGTEMIIWGGGVAAKYNPVSGSWAPISTVDAPIDRIGHTVIWTGTEMIVWGGTIFYDDYETARSIGDGGRYNPATDSWTPIPIAAGSPSDRRRAKAVRAGTEMIIWGGVDNSGYVNSGSRYNLSTGVWTPMPAPPAGFVGRVGHSAVWSVTGKLLIWGGQNENYNPLGDGAIYTRSTNSWTTMNDTGSPGAREGHATLWFDSLGIMTIWGGRTIDFLGGGTAGAGATYLLSTDTWVPMTENPSVDGRDNVLAVPTPNGLFVWGGSETIVTGNPFTPNIFRQEPSTRTTEFFTDGALYNPLTNTWTAVTDSAGTIASRDYASGISADGEVLMWGGSRDADGILNDGGRYDISTATWAPLSAPLARKDHSSVWTGTEWIIWGGSNEGGDFLDSGFLFDPVTGQRRTIDPTGAPSGRANHTAVWAPEIGKMIVWGGWSGGSIYRGDGAYYDPVTDSWSPVSLSNDPSPRGGHTAIWTGDRMIVWGGNSSAGRFSDGKALSIGNTWTTISTSGDPAARTSHTAVWTGEKMVIWGGIDGLTRRSTGGRYDPATNTWQSTAITNRPSARFLHTTVWTGDEMIVFGGDDSAGATNTGAAYDPVANTWRPLPMANAPIEREFHTAVWSGSEMIVFGGTSGIFDGEILGDGARYSPSSDVWFTLRDSNTQAGLFDLGLSSPPARMRHSAVWAGGKMLIFGGVGTQNFDDMWSYELPQLLHLYQNQ